MVFYVFQGETYNLEREGNYVWSPQLNISGKRNKGYTNMLDVHKGDFILHGKKQKLVAISIAQNDCYIADQPVELENAKKSVVWGREGYRIDCEYFDLQMPLKMKSLQPWLAAHYVKGYAFTPSGGGNTGYMYHLSDEQALYILKKAKEIQSDKGVLRILDAARLDIYGEKDYEYEPSEADDINELVAEQTEGAVPGWSVGAEQQEMTVSSATGRPIPKRNPQRAADALAHAHYLCEYNNSDRLFLRKNGKPYTEPHHLVPISRYHDFNGNSVDVMENIVSLCSHCHNLLHYGRMEDKRPVLEKLYNDRKEALHNRGLDLTLERLIDYYK